MSKLVIALTCLLSFQISHAQSFKVVKIAGKKAIVEVDDPKMINVNQTYNVGGGDVMSSSYTGSGGYKHDNAISFNFSYVSVSSSSVSTLTLAGSFLLNLKLCNCAKASTVSIAGRSPWRKAIFPSSNLLRLHAP